MNTWLEDYLQKTDLTQYPVGLRTEGGIGFQVGRDTVSAFVGHPVHYLENREWKPITLEYIPATGEFEGSWFGWDGVEGSVTYCGYKLFAPKNIIWNGVARPLYFLRQENRLIADVPNLGIYEIVFSEWGINELFTVPEPVEGVLEFDVQQTAGWDAYLYKKERRLIGSDLTGDVYTLTLDMPYPLVIDPDYSGTTDDGHTEATGAATYISARNTSTGFSSSTTSLTGQQFTTGTYRVYRTHYKFDTSGIPDTDTITQVNMKLVSTQDSSTTDFDVTIVKQDWSGQDPLSAGNREAAYDGCLAATQDVVWRNTSGMSINTQYTSPDMDTSWVSKTGYTYYGVLSSRDIGNTAPSGNEYISLALTDHATSGYRPVLTVAHSAATTTRRSLALLGVG